MSAKALLLGVQTRLRSAACLNDVTGKIAGVEPNGQPPNGCGQWFYAIHHGGVSGDDPNALSDDRLHSVLVTITARMGYAPKDRRGERITTDEELLDRADAIADYLHQDDLSRIEANKLIVGTAEYADIHGGGITKNGFVEPLKFSSISTVQEAPAGWVGADQNEILIVVVTFVGARLVKYIGS